MDLESECSALESVEDSDSIAPECLENLGVTVTNTRFENNGTCHIEHAVVVVVDGKPPDDIIKLEGSLANSPSVAGKGKSPGPSIGSSPPAATKGRGLKKWRRIPREVIKEASSNSGSNKKRGPTVSQSATKQRNDASTSSTNAAVNVGLFGDSGLGDGPLFAARGDSENSEDHSSRSSTAASVPRTAYEIPPGGLGFDMNGTRSPVGKSWGIPVQPGGQLGKGRTGTSKKARGIKIEKENSHSSMESDSRSSNFVFVQGTNSVTSNGIQSGRSTNYDEEYSDDAQHGDKYLSKEAQTASRKNEVESEEASQEDLAANNSWEMKDEKTEDHVESMHQDALVESVIILHSVQEALEREVQKLRDVGKEDPLAYDDLDQPSESTSVKPDGDGPSSSEEVPFGESRANPSSTLETQMIELKQNVVHLQSKLEEARVMVELKEAKVVELESTLNVGGMKSELEELFKQRIEAEVEYIAISETIQNLRVGPIDNVRLMFQQKNLASEHAQVINKLGDVKSKATVLKRQAEKLETAYEEIVETEDVLKLQNRVCRFTSCFTIQLMLLLVVVYVFVSQLYSDNMEVVPPT